jgi:hypothetical protein
MDLLKPPANQQELEYTKYPLLNMGMNFQQPQFSKPNVKANSTYHDSPHSSSFFPNTTSPLPSYHPISQVDLPSHFQPYPSPHSLMDQSQTVSNLLPYPRTYSSTYSPTTTLYTPTINTNLYTPSSNTDLYLSYPTSLASNAYSLPPSTLPSRVQSPPTPFNMDAILGSPKNKKTKY